MADKLQEGLRTKQLGKRIFFTHEIDSTNERAKRLAKLGAEEGTVAVAEMQSAGRGRLGREWFSPEGGLWFSVVLRPEMSASEAAGLVFVAGLAVAEVLKEVYGLRVETKWPNDVLVDRRKISGILCEMSTKGETVSYVVVGIGINVNFNVAKALPQTLRGTTASVQGLLGRKVRVEDLFGAVLEKLEETYDLYVKEGIAPILDMWKRFATFLGREVEVVFDDEKLRGVALGIDAEGRLVLKLQDGSLKAFVAGDVSLDFE
jgi:BirA family biotin operon repressor/biotin-[acetyl-CoA-carboxylase] ligase